MKYTINDLEKESREWWLRQADEMESVFGCELPQPEFERTAFFQEELPAAFEFATEGKYRGPGPLDMGEFESVHIIGGAVFSVSSEDSKKTLYPFMSHLKQNLTARQKLEEGEDLTVAEIACLANVDERTVRNAAAAKKLATKKVGGSTYIQSHIAEMWLTGRKGYKPTYFLGESTPSIFSDLYRKLEEEKRSLKDVLQSVGINECLSVKFDQLKNDSSIRFSNKDLFLLARELGFDPMHFIKLQTLSDIVEEQKSE